MPLSPYYPFDLWRLAPESMVFHLYTNDVAIVPAMEPSDFAEATFPGYEAKSGKSFAADVSSVGDDVVSRQSDERWVRTASGAAQIVRGLFITYPVPDGVPALLGAMPLPDNWEPAVKGDFLKLVMTVTVSKEIDDEVLVNIAPLLPFVGNGDPMSTKFRGTELALLKKAKKTLLQITTRDAGIVSRSTRSRKSPVAVIPATDAALVAAFTLVKNRVDACLAL